MIFRRRWPYAQTNEVRRRIRPPIVNEISTTVEQFTFATYDAAIDRDLGTNLSSFTFSTYPADVTLGINLETNLESFTFTTYQAGISENTDVESVTKNFTFTTYQADIDTGNEIDAEVKNFTFSTYPASIDRDIESSTTAFTFSTYQADITVGTSIDAAVKNFTFSTYQAGIDKPSDIPGSTAAFTFSTYPAEISVGGNIRANLTEFTFATYAAELSLVEGALDAPSFTELDPVLPKLHNIQSDTVVLTGTLTNSSFDLTISNGEYSKNGGVWSSIPSTVMANDTIKVRGSSSDSYNTSETVTLTVGSHTVPFVITTIPSYEMEFKLNNLEVA